MSKAFQSVREFEEIVAGYAGSKYAVAVDSCTVKQLDRQIVDVQLRQKT